MKLGRYFRQISKIRNQIATQRRSPYLNSGSYKRREKFLYLILINYILKGLFKKSFSVRLPMETIKSKSGVKTKIPNSWESLFESIASNCGLIVTDEKLLLETKLVYKTPKKIRKLKIKIAELKIKKELTRYYLTYAT